MRLRRRWPETSTAFRLDNRNGQSYGRKMKKADKNLTVAMMFCVVMGLMILTACLRNYFKQLHEHLDWNTPVPAVVYESLLACWRVLNFLVLPFAGISFIFIAYLIWDYRRKLGSIKEHDEPNA